MTTKAVIFDFDGTLSLPNELPNSWRRVWAKIGKTDLDDKYYESYSKGELSYPEWTDKVIACFIENGVNDDILKEIALETKRIGNIEKVFKILKDNDVEVYVLSGGIKNIINHILEDIAGCITKIEAQEFLFDESGRLTGITRLDHSVEFKDEFIINLMKKKGLQPEEVVFFGNGKNDETVYRSGVRTICINPDDAHYNDRRLWSDVILSTDDLFDIMPYLSLKKL